MSNQLTTFNFNFLPVRVVERDGEPWFVAADVARVLGFTTTSGAGRYLRHLDDAEVNTITLGNGNRGNPNKKIVSESGLYKLTMKVGCQAA